MNISIWDERKYASTIVKILLILIVYISVKQEDQFNMKVHDCSVYIIGRL